ncbi:DNA polymerase I, partial [Patescibacteria group bacterium]|nr:DNA polymerase I [Patescibacteria group bacterium]
VKSDGRIHTSFNQTITATGRLSSSNPNLQNIPIKTDVGRLIRRAFIAPPGHQLIAADYSQIELRIMAHIAQEPTMIKAFQAGQDIHTSTAALIYNVDLNKVTNDQRYNAKTINFSIIYGAGPRNIAGQLDISFSEAKEFIDNYFTKFPLVKKYMDKAIKYTQTKEYAKTLYGRLRHIPEINSRTPQLKAAAERIAINMPIQGTAADIMKLAMIHIYHAITDQNLPIKIISQVHDELIFEVPDKLINSFSQLIKKEMEKVCTLKVPLKVDIEVGQNWGEMKKI